MGLTSMTSIFTSTKTLRRAKWEMRWDGFSNLNSPVIVREWNHGGENIPKNVTVNYFIRINP